MRKRHYISEGQEWARDLVEEIERDGLPADGEVIYRGRNVVARLRRGGKRVIVKEFGVPNIVNRYVYTHLRKSKARRSLENAERLLRMGFDTAEPLAWIETKRGMHLDKSYYLTLEVEGRDLRDWESLSDRELEGLAACMGELHSAGVYHKDFSPGNVLVDSEGRFYLIDLNRMRFGEKRVRILLQNFRALTVERNLVDFARRYAGYSPFGLTAPEMEARAVRERRKFARSRGIEP